MFIREGCCHPSNGHVLNGILVVMEAFYIAYLSSAGNYRKIHPGADFIQTGIQLTLGFCPFQVVIFLVAAIGPYLLHHIHGPLRARLN